MSYLRTTLPGLAVLACGFVSGCSSLMTAQAIHTFAESLAASDLDAVKASSSDHFDEKALRLSEALQDFDRLNLPTGKVSIVKVEEVSDGERHVKVEVGERKQELLYKLVWEPDARRWVVDDIFVTQKKDGLKEPITQPVTEQMDLLLTVREFLSSWQAGSREDVLAAVTPELADVLSGLSPAHLQQLTTQVAGKEHVSQSFKPDAWFDGEQAGVLLARRSGKLLIELKRQEGQWRVNDLAIQSRSEAEEVRSVRKLAQFLRSTSEFLTAFAEGNLGELAKSASDSFYRNALSVGDLSTVRLPIAQLTSAPYKVHMHNSRADLVLEAGGDTYMFTLAEAAPSASPEGQPVRVDEVTLYEVEGDQVKRLSALFTAHAMTEIFAQAIAERNLPRLKQASTSDFNQRVWVLVDEEVLRALPLEEIEPARPHVVATVFQGALTEVTVTQGSRALTYVLRDSHGRMAVDDVLLPVVNRPNSLKQNLRAIIPVIAMARAANRDDLHGVRDVSSAELNRMVWSLAEQIPDLGYDLVGHLSAPVTALTMTEDRADLQLGNDRWGADVKLTRAGERFLVDEVLFIAGPESHQRAELKRVTRLNLASGTD